MSPASRVGYATLIEGEGPLVVGPGPGAHWRDGDPARGARRSGHAVRGGLLSLNGNGEMTGTVWIEEAGALSLPIMITNTHAVGTAHRGRDRVDDRRAIPSSRASGRCRSWPRPGTAT